ncbi:hypothetical protein ME7_00828, partial [Bartonella birtlesii LL-WM9]
MVGGILFRGGMPPIEIWVYLMRIRIHPEGRGASC